LEARVGIEQKTTANRVRVGHFSPLIKRTLLLLNRTPSLPFGGHFDARDISDLAAQEFAHRTCLPADGQCIHAASLLCAGQWLATSKRDLHEFAEPVIECDLGMANLFDIAEAFLIAKVDGYDFFSGVLLKNSADVENWWATRLQHRSLLRL
jgi:hypothetical protein